MEDFSKTLLWSAKLYASGKKKKVNKTACETPLKQSGVIDVHSLMYDLSY